MPGEIRIDDGSVGFFNQNGKLKSSKENSAAVAKIEQAIQATKGESSSQAGAADDASSIGDISSALGSVRTRTNEDVNNLINTINIDRENLKEARNIARSQLETVKEIQAAEEAGDSKKAEKLRGKFAELEESRKAHSDKVRSDNAEITPDRVASIRVGNSTKGTFAVKAVEFSESSGVSLDSKKDLRQAEKALKQEISDIKQQIDEHRTVREEVKEVARSARQEINSIEESSIYRIEEATKRTDELTNKIRSGAQSTLESNTLSKIQQDIVSKLFS